VNQARMPWKASAGRQPGESGCFSLLRDVRVNTNDPRRSRHVPKFSAANLAPINPLNDPHKFTLAILIGEEIGVSLGEFS